MLHTIGAIFNSYELVLIWFLLSVSFNLSSRSFLLFNIYIIHYNTVFLYFTYNEVSKKISRSYFFQMKKKSVSKCSCPFWDILHFLTYIFFCIKYFLFGKPHFLYSIVFCYIFFLKISSIQIRIQKYFISRDIVVISFGKVW